MKGCLKLTSPMPSPGPDSQFQHLVCQNGGARCCHTPTTASSSSTAVSASIISATNNGSMTPNQTHRKCVAFCAEGSEKVYPADEWDRTPTEPARKLSYQDLLELKEIQRSLPHADQPPDIVTGKPGKQFLSGVPIVLLPLLGSGSGESGGHSEGANGAEKGYFSEHGRTNGHANVHTNGNGAGWGPPSITGFGRQVTQSPTQAQPQGQAKPVRPPFPFPPRPVPLSTGGSTPSFTSTRVPTSPTSPTSITQPWQMNFQSKNKVGSSPSSPTAPYPSSSSTRPSSTSTTPTHPYSNFSQQQIRTRTQTQSQSQSQPRMPWTHPPSLSHLLPSRPIKPREKPKFEFITLLETGASSDGSSGPSPSGGANGVESMEVPTTKVGPEVLLHPISKLPSGLIEVERGMVVDHHHHDEQDHDLEDHDQDHDLISVTSSSSCPSLCTSSCSSSCSASEVDTDHEHEHGYESEGQYYSAKRPTCITTHVPAALDLDVGLRLGGGIEGGRMLATMKKKPKPKKEKKKKFIVVNDMEIELDDSESESDCEEEDSDVMSGSITSTGTSTSRETTTITTTKTVTTEKTTTTTTTTTNSGSGSPRGIVAPVPTRSTFWSSYPPSPSPSPPTLLMTPPTTPPSVQISRFGNHTNMSNKPVHSPTSPPSTASRGRMRATQKKRGSSTSRERSGSDSNGGGGSPSSSLSCSTVGSPVKVKMP